MGDLPELHHTATIQLQALWLKNVVFLCDQEERYKIETSKSHNMCLSILKDLFWETREKERVGTFFGKGKLKEQGWLGDEAVGQSKIRETCIREASNILNLVNQRGRIHNLLKLRGQPSC